MSVRKYFCPDALDRALDLLNFYGREAKILAGGTDLLVQQTLEPSRERVFISLRNIQELKALRKTEEGGFFIGAMVRHGELVRSAPVKECFPALAKASRCVGSPSIRNLATIGGNICNGSPAADTALPLLAYDARAIIVSPSGERIVELEDFFEGPGTTVLQTGEILKGFLLQPRTDRIADYEKLGLRKAMEIAVVNVCVVLTLDEKGNCSNARIALGAVAPRPMRAKKAEQILEGEAMTKELIEKCAEVAEGETQPISDLRASATYRKEMARILVGKMISRLVGVG